MLTSEAAGRCVLKAEAEGWSVLTSRLAKPGGVLPTEGRRHGQDRLL
jgi:hypothetical protein